MSDRVCGCGAELGPDWYVCRGCVGTFRGLLSDLGGLMDDVDAAIGKQLRFGGGGGRRGSDRPLPIDVLVVETAWTARQAVLKWVDWVAAVRGHPVPAAWSEVGTYLRESSGWLSRHPSGPEAIAAVVSAVRRVRRSTDAPPEHPYVGKCSSCGHEVHASATAVIAGCRYCGAEVDVPTLRDETLRRVRDHLVTAADAERLFDEMGIKLTADLVRKWRKTW